MIRNKARYLGNGPVTVADLGIDETMFSVFQFHEAFDLHNAEMPDLPFYTDPEVHMELARAAHILNMVSKDLRRFCEANPDKSIMPMRGHLMTEELAETLDAMSKGDLLMTMDGFADQRYVQDGSILALGLARGFLPAFREVHRSNMTKLGADGKPVLSDGGRVIKGPHYEKPNLYPALDEAHRGLLTPLNSQS